MSINNKWIIDYKRNCKVGNSANNNAAWPQDQDPGPRTNIVSRGTPPSRAEHVDSLRSTGEHLEQQEIYPETKTALSLLNRSMNDALRMRHNLKTSQEKKFDALDSRESRVAQRVYHCHCMYHCVYHRNICVTANVGTGKDFLHAEVRRERVVYLASPRHRAGAI